MAEYELSNKADEDLTEIYTFTYQHWGETQADAYLLSLEERFRMLAEQPRLGMKADHIRKGYFRCEHGSHSIFYKTQKGGIFIVRVLHNRMDREQHL